MAVAATAILTGGGVRVVTRVLQDAARDQPDKVAILFEDRGYTYSELWARGRRAASVLRGAGVGPSRLRLISICFFLV